MPEKLMKLQEVMERTSLCRSHVYTLSGFPKPIKIGKRAAAWISSEIDGWVNATIRANRSEKGC